MKYLIVLEKSGTGYSAYSPDLPGCVAAGGTRAATEARMREAVEFHIEGLREEGAPVPPPASEAAFVEIPGAAGNP